MIPDVDQALKTLIERDALDSEQVDVAFDAPTREWASRRNTPTVDIYLYDIREDVGRREYGWLDELDGTRPRARRRPPRHFKLSYLVTAWTHSPEDEHRLLSSLMASFLRFDSLPRDVLTGPLAELGIPLPVGLALPPPEDRSFADVWTALGGELKPSIDLVVTAPIVTGRAVDAGPPVQFRTTLIAGGKTGPPAAETRRGRDAAASHDSGGARTAGRRQRRRASE